MARVCRYRGKQKTFWSCLTDTGYDIPTLAEDIRVVTDSLAPGEMVLIGHSPHITHCRETLDVARSFLKNVLR